MGCIAERGTRGRGHEPWLLMIPCRHGRIYPHGGAYLGASTDHRGPIANRLTALPFVRIVQNGDDGINVVFRVDDFDQIAELMRPKRRRKLPPAHSANLTRAGAAAIARHRNSNDARSECRRDPIGTGQPHCNLTYPVTIPHTPFNLHSLLATSQGSRRSAARPTSVHPSS